jgi:hypothetical protein
LPKRSNGGGRVIDKKHKKAILKNKNRRSSPLRALQKQGLATPLVDLRKFIKKNKTPPHPSDNSTKKSLKSRQSPISVCPIAPIFTAQRLLAQACDTILKISKKVATFGVPLRRLVARLRKSFYLSNYLCCEPITVAS